jgi:BlaI family transcriptional regulator, penicillinase repressor
MAKLPRISEGEWLVMEAVWAGAAPVTASEIVDGLSGRTGWNPRTIKTMLNRLVKKGALRFEADGKRYLYRPAVKRDACVRGESRSFLRRVFGGHVAPMLAHFVEDAKLTPEQVRELRKLLDGKDR